MRILYIGNHLGKGGKYPSVAQSLAPHLEPNISFRLISRQRNKLLRLVHMIASLIWYGKREQPVVIDVYSSMAFYYALICGVACRVLYIRYICVLHGGDLPRRLQQDPMKSRWVFSGACKLLAPSGYLQYHFQQHGYMVEVLPNPIDVSLYPFKLRQNPAPRMLWVRAFDATYNPLMAIHLLAGLLKTYPDAQLCMVGPDKDGSMQACKELAQELGIPEHLNITGVLSKSEWIELSEGYDIFINTTNFDNTPVSVLEAMALGFPVVSTDVGGMPYLITQELNGMLVTKNDKDGMLVAILRILSNTELAAFLSSNAREFANKMDINKVAKEFLIHLGRENCITHHT